MAMADAASRAFPLLWEELPGLPGSSRPPDAAAGSPELPEPAADAGVQQPAPLRVMSLNILADGLARGDDSPRESPDSPRSACPLPAAFEAHGAGGVVYGAEAGATTSFTFRCSATHLAWSRRWPQLLSLILELQPDIIGLQEVDLLDDPHEGLQAHDAEIRADLREAGYRGAFVKKFGRACDGVGLFWRAARLRQAGSSETWRLARTVHVALAQPLLLDGRVRLTAVCTHLKAGQNKDAEGVRTEQATALLKRLARHANAVVLADINAHCRESLVVGRPESEHAEEVLQPQVYPMLTTELRSAYREVLDDEPSYTTWGGWMDQECRLVCDYILLRGGLFLPRRVLQVPAVKDVVGYAERLPNPDHPSDHVPLVADLALPADWAEQASWQPAPAPSKKKRGKRI